MYARTPELHEDTVPTCNRWLSCGGVVSELPTPATSCRHTGQMYYSGLLHVFRCKLCGCSTCPENSTRNISRIEYTAREPRPGDDVSRFRSVCSKIFLPSLCSQILTIHTPPRRHSARVEYILDRLHLAQSTRRRFGCQFTHTWNTKTVPCTPNQQPNLYNFIGRPESTPRIKPPNALRTAVSYRMCSREPR